MIHPFEGIDTITGINLTGSVVLNSDTSLVRVIISSHYGLEFMIFESYPLITESRVFNITNACDETCFLDCFIPDSLEIQIIDAALYLDNLEYETSQIQNLVELQYSSKRAADAIKIGLMEENIPKYGMNWTAGDNGIVARYYHQKQKLFVKKYNSLGYEYYSGGVFEFLGHEDYPACSPELVLSFDWRNRHGANNPYSPYWDGDVLGTGWLTSVKDQGDCGSCWAFSAVGATEALANLYAAQHLDFSLSEMQVLSCGDVNGSCEDGHVDSALAFIKETGIVTDSCCKYTAEFVNCGMLQICQNQDTVISIEDTLGFIRENDSIRSTLIKRGPLPIIFYYPNLGMHAVVLTGFEFDPKDSSMVWIFKNSWGEYVNADHGFERRKISYITGYPLVDPVYLNSIPLEVECRDEDLDGFCFWGVGPKPDSCNCSDIEDCDDSNPFVGGYDQNYNCTCIFEMDSVSHHISSDTVWADSTYVNFDVIIDSGATLTINSFAAFAPEAMITVLPGARLILDNAYLTKVCPELWEGIEVWGSDTVQYLSEYFGRVEIRNNSIIEFAENGIANHCKRCSYNAMQSGGIILAENSTFRNNRTDILLAPFKNLWYGNELPYLGIFKNCHFQTTEDFYPEFEPKSHVEMKDVYGVRFFGCNFENSANTSAVPYSMRGTGVSGIDVQFSLEKYCNVQGIEPCPHQNLIQCEFNKLEYGIKSLNSVSRRTLNIQDVLFYNNQTAISLSGIDYASVLSNEVQCKRIEGLKENQFAGGLFLEGCTGYHIEGNWFHAGLFEKGLVYGIGVKNSGPDDNEIYNNTFQNLDIGIISVGENRGRESGLCLKCNDMANAGNDFFVVELNDPPSGVYQGINFYQGNPNDSISLDAPAGNTFTFFPQSADTLDLKYYNYLNTAEDIWYVYHRRQLEPLTYPLDSNFTKETIELKQHDIPYEKSVACPSGLGGGNLKSIVNPRAVLVAADNKISMLASQLTLLIDGGNTLQLNFEILNSLPDEAYELSQQLMDYSPYLSDTVMKQAIYKENVLPNAMIRDILEANPHSAKSLEIMNTLNVRSDTMPTFMIDQIMSGRERLGDKELLEVEIQSWKQVRARAKADLFRQFLLDTNEIDPIDSMITFLQGEPDLESRYELVLAYWNEQDTAQATQTLLSIPLEFALSSDQANTHLQYLTYFEILQQMQGSNWNASELDSANIQYLYDIMAGSNVKISAHSRGLLVDGGLYDHLETINIPDHVKSTLFRSPSLNKPDKLTQPDHLRLFPNPVGDYVILHYYLNGDGSSGLITLHDLVGKPLRILRVKSDENQLVISLIGLAEGLYIFNLYSNRKLLDTDKLIKWRN